MSMFGSQITSMHNDVLTANPETNDLKRNLVGEIKNRAKNTIAEKNYPVAIELYSKAIEVIPDDDDNEKAILYSNRSMCYNGMNKYSEAEMDAQKSIELNPSYTKGYFRKTAALIGQNRFKQARDCVTIGLNQMPNDKDLQSQLSRIESELSKISNSTKSVSASSSSAAQSNKSTLTNSKNSSNESLSTAPTNLPEDDHEDLTKEVVRGYKKLDDGRVTTFFNNTLDEETKALIGDIRPKKIDSSDNLSNGLENNSTVGSSWNAAGTFESRDLTTWALEYIKSNLNNDHIGGDLKLLNHNDLKFILKVTEVKEVHGDAQIVITRGKRKHVCDITFTIVWQLSIDGEAASNLKTVDGTLTIQDFSSDGDYEPAWTITSKVENKDNNLIKSAKIEIEKCVQQALQLFVQELKSKV